MALIHFSEEGFDKALYSDKLMMVDFWATWCGPCKMLAPVIDIIAKDYEAKDCVIGKVDVDQEPGLAQRYGVMSIPTVLFFKGGEEIERIVGVNPPDAYLSVLDGNL